MPVSYWNFSTSIDRIARYVSGQKKQKKERNGRKESDTYWFGRVVTAGEWSESSSLFLLASPPPTTPKRPTRRWVGGRAARAEPDHRPQRLLINVNGIFLFFSIFSIILFIYFHLGLYSAVFFAPSFYSLCLRACLLPLVLYTVDARRRRRLYKRTTEVYTHGREPKINEGWFH
jgi:hypothetical protein